MIVAKLAKVVVFISLVISNSTNCMSENNRPRHLFVVPTSLRQSLPNLSSLSFSTSSPVDTETATTLQSIQEAVRARIHQAAEERRAMQNQLQEVFPQAEPALQSGGSSLVRTITERFYVREISLEELSERMPVSPYLVRLRIRARPGQKISSDQLRLIGKKFPRITELDLSGTGLGSEGLAVLTQQPFASRLNHLDISRNLITWEAIRDHMSAFAGLTSLDISYNFVQDAGLVALAQQPFARNLSYLNLRSAGILLGRSVSLTPDTPKITSAKIKASLDSFKSLKRLNISNNSIRNAGFALLAQSSVAPYLTDLNVSSNELTTAGIEDNISAFARLTNLDISFNPINDQGLNAIAEQPFASHLTLYAGSTDITDAGLNKNSHKFKGLVLKSSSQK